MTAAVTPLEALRRLYEVVRKVEADEAQGFDNLLQGEIAVARDVLREHKAMRAAPVVPVAAQPVVPEGWTVTHAVPWEGLTDKANIKLRYSVKRDAAPFCSEEGVRIWFGPTLELAMKAGCDALGLPYAAPSLEAQPAGEVVRDKERLDWLSENYFSDQKDEWDELQSPNSIKWKFFGPMGIQGRVRDVIDAAMAQGDK